MKEMKNLTYKELKKDQEISGYQNGKKRYFFTGYVKDINSSFVTIERWRRGGDEETIESQNTMFFVPMPEDEIEVKYGRKAAEVLRGIQNRLASYEIGYHEMWNAWLFGSPIDIAKYGEKEKFKVVGYCPEIVPKPTFYGETLDIGVCAEYENGERFWCHFQFNQVKRMIDEWGYLMEKFV